MKIYETVQAMVSFKPNCQFLSCLRLVHSTPGKYFSNQHIVKVKTARSQIPVFLGLSPSSVALTLLAFHNYYMLEVLYNQQSEMHQTETCNFRRRVCLAVYTCRRPLTPLMHIMHYRRQSQVAPTTKHKQGTSI